MEKLLTRWHMKPWQLSRFRPWPTVDLRPSPDRAKRDVVQGGNYSLPKNSKACANDSDRSGKPIIDRNRGGVWDPFFYPCCPLKLS